MIKYSEMKNRQATAVWEDVSKGKRADFGRQRLMASSSDEEMWKYSVQPFTSFPKMHNTKYDRIIYVLTGKMFVDVEGRARVERSDGDVVVLEKATDYVFGTLAEETDLLIVQSKKYADKLKLTGDVTKAFPEPVTQIENFVIRPEVKPYVTPDPVTRENQVEKFKNWQNQARPDTIDKQNIEQMTKAHKKFPGVSDADLKEYEEYSNAPSISLDLTNPPPAAQKSSASPTEAVKAPTQKPVQETTEGAESADALAKEL